MRRRGCTLNPAKRKNQMYSLPTIRFSGNSAGTGFHRSARFAQSALAHATGFSLAAVLALALAETHAAGPKRCDWHGPLSGGEKPYAKCVDFASMEGKTV